MENSSSRPSSLVAFLAYGFDDQQAQSLCSWLGVVPLALIIPAPWFIYKSTQKPLCLRDKTDTLLTKKITASVALLSVQLYRFFDSSNCWQGSNLISSQALSCVESVSYLAILYTQHLHDPTPSAFISMYLALNFSLRGSLAWLQFDRCYLTTHGLPMVGEALTLASMLWLHESSKWEYMPQELRARHSFESCYGWWARTTGLWLFPSIHRAGQEDLTLSDLQPLAAGTSAQVLSGTFMSAWREFSENSYPLLHTCWEVEKQTMLQAMLFKTVHSILKLGFPYFLLHFLQLLDLQQNEKMAGDLSRISQRISVFVVGSLFLGITVAESVILTKCQSSRLRLRTMLTTAIFEKSYALSDSDISKSATLSLITSDITTITNGIDVLMDNISYLVQTIICCCIMWSLLGPGTVSVLVICAIVFMASDFVFKQIGSYSIQAAGKTEARSLATQNMISNIKSIKLTNHASAIKHAITKLRNLELSSTDPFGWGWTIPHLFVASTFTLMPLLVLFTPLGPEAVGGVPVAVTFVMVLVLFAFMVRDFNEMPRRVSVLLLSMQRIEKHLLLASAQTQPVGSRGSPQTNHQTKVNGMKSVTKQAFQITDATISPSSTAPAILHNLTWAVKRGSLVVVTGNVGTGKTTLLRTLINRTVVLDGNVTVNADSIAYCGQTEWIRNATIKENIVGPAAYDDMWYRKVVYRCCLTEDIARLPNGDNEIVGPQWLKLDSSQRHRLALARAVYSRASLVLLDDVFSTQSAVDAQCMITRLLGPRCPLRQGMTVIIATRAAEMFAEYANRIIRITNTGTLTPFVPLHGNIDGGNNGLVQQLDGQCPSADMDKVQKLSEEVTSRFRVLAEPNRARRKPPYSLFLDQMNKPVAVACLVTLLLFGIFETLPLICVQNWLQFHNTTSFTLRACICLTLTGEVIFACCTNVFQNQVVRPVQTEMHEKLVDAVLNAPMQSLNNSNAVEASSLLSKGVETIDNIMFLGIFHSVYGAMNFLSLYIFAAWQHPFSIVQLPITFVAAFLLHRALSPISLHLRHLEETASEALYTSFSETVSGGAHIHAFAWREYHWKGVKVKIGQAQMIDQYIWTQKKLLSFLLDLVATCQVILVTSSVISSVLPAYQAGLALSMCIRYKSTFRNMLIGWDDIDICATTLGRVERFTTDLRPNRTVVGTQLTEQWPQGGAVEFRDAKIKLAHPSQELSLTIDNLSIPSQAEAGIIGSANAGKTTLLMSLLNLVPYEGSITIDGVEARNIPAHRLNEVFTVIPQLPILLPFATVRQTLVPDEILVDQQKTENEQVITTILYALGLFKVINDNGGLQQEFSKLRLTAAQLQRVAVAQGLIKYRFRPSAIVLNDSALNTLDIDSLMRMDSVTREIASFSGSTVIQTASTFQALERGTFLAYISDGKVRQANWFGRQEE